MAAEVQISDEERQVIEHALGISPGKSPYRNHFAAAVQTPDFDACQSCVSKGLMVKGDSLGYGNYFHVTPEGQALVTRAADAA